jgi:hypothetical protein
MHVAGLARIYAADVDVVICVISRNYRLALIARCDVGELITVNMLPDDVLLEAFDFYVTEDFRLREKQRIEGWQMLAHVYRRWRSVGFKSPRRLNLRLLCTPKTRARDLDIWPPLPLIIRDVHVIFGNEPSSVDNIIAALEHNDRVCQIGLGCLSSSQMGYVTDSAAMHEPFPELTDLRLNMFVNDGTGPIFSDSFLGGTVPRLQSLYQPTFVCHSPRLSFTLLYSPFRVHPIRGDGHRALCVEQPRVTLPPVSIPTTLPCPREPTSASASTDTLYPPQSHQNSIHRGQRIFGGDLGPDRCPSTQRVVYSLLQSNHI